VRKIISVWLLCLIVWNGAFGAFGGVLLCLHEDMTMHVEAEAEGEDDCGSIQSSEGSEIACISPAESCVDIELSGHVLPPARTNEVEFLSAAPIFALVFLLDLGWEPTRALDDDFPGLIVGDDYTPQPCMAVLVAEKIQLRI